jgi:hypothetical protein
MKNILDVIDDVTKFIIGGDDESLLDKKKKTMGFVSEAIKPKRKYTRRKKKNASKK